MKASVDGNLDLGDYDSNIGMLLKKLGQRKGTLQKLIDQLRLVALKNGQQVIDQPVDFDTIDLSTKRYNSKKQYITLSKMVFDQLNRLMQ